MRLFSYRRHVAMSADRTLCGFIDYLCRLRRHALNGMLDDTATAAREQDPGNEGENVRG